MTDMLPRLPEGPRASAPLPLRFEDMTQDGRLVLEAIPTAFGRTVWRSMLRDAEETRALSAQGIIPIVTRLRVHGTDGPFAISPKIVAEASCRFAHAHDGRFILEMWADLYGTLHGRGANAPTVGEPAPERALAGRVLSELVLTRPFAPPGERRVRNLDFPGAPKVIERPAMPPFESIATLPEGATSLEPAMRVDPVPIVFGLAHTDRNMHVNSLVYLRVFEEAALRRFLMIGRDALLLARTVDIVYRKPCFAGQTMRVLQQAFESGGKPGVATMLIPEADADQEPTVARAKAHAYARMLFDP